MQDNIESSETSPASEGNDTPVFSFPRLARTTPASIRVFLNPVRQNDTYVNCDVSHNAVKTLGMKSLERRFLLQQTLETPVSSASFLSETRVDESRNSSKSEYLEEEIEDEEEFVIHSQPAYERVHSQRVDELEEQYISCTDVRTEDGGTAMTSVNEETEKCNQEKLTSNSNYGQDSGFTLTQPTERLNSTELVDDLSNKPGGVTPAMQMEDACLTDHDSIPSKRPFCVFRPACERKKLYIIRHGESEYNAAISRRGTSFSDPLIFDAPLTSKGKAQAISLRATVASWSLPEETVWITSPLSRAIETLLLARPYPSGNGRHRSPDENAPLNEQSSSGSNTLGICDSPWDDVFVLPTISERVLTSGDIGMKPSDLSARFPQFSEQFSLLPEVWWWCHPDDPGCAYRKTVGKSEPKKSVEARVVEFKKWIQSRPEKVFVAVGHSLFWKEMVRNIRQTRCENSIPNCGYKVLHI